MVAGMFLSEAEVNELCNPLTQPAAQVRFLRGLGLTVTVKPNGRPAVVRSHAETVLSGLPASAAVPTSPAGKMNIDPPKPNIEGFMKMIRGGRGARPR